MSILQTSWDAAWRALAPNVASAKQTGDALFTALLEAYVVPHRHYHTLLHLQECIVQLEASAHLAQRQSEFAIALWFHDTIFSSKT